MNERTSSAALSESPAQSSAGVRGSGVEASLGSRISRIRVRAVRKAAKGTGLARSDVVCSELTCSL